MSAAFAPSGAVIALSVLFAPVKLTPRRVAGGVRERLRARFPDRVVHRDVLGARLALPWSHRLPDYTRQFPTYGLNLVELAAALADGSAPLSVLDVGANVGDSALQILARVDARIVCVDGDPHWWPFLYRNVGIDRRISVERSMITTDARAELTPVRTFGTTKFVPGTDVHGVAHTSPAELRARHPQLERVDLIKSDTDGYDTRIVPELAREWAANSPVLFFEYDPGLSRGAGDDDPAAVFTRLSELGYAHALVWDNFGHLLGTHAVDDLPRVAADLDGDAPFPRLGYHYWDVAAVHASDARGRAALDKLAGQPSSR